MTFVFMFIFKCSLSITAVGLWCWVCCAMHMTREQLISRVWNHVYHRTTTRISHPTSSPTIPPQYLGAATGRLRNNRTQWCRDVCVVRHAVRWPGNNFILYATDEWINILIRMCLCAIPWGAEQSIIVDVEEIFRLHHPSSVYICRNINR